jgi:hypothetical protein
MHYIAGTEITIAQAKRGVIRPGMSSEQIKTLKRGNQPKECESFQQGVKYTLTRIYKKDEQSVIYKFVGIGGDVVEIPFPSITIAERFISDVRGDQLTQIAKPRERTD